MILLDTSALLSAIDASQRRYARCVAVIGGAEGAVLLSPFILAELDYLLFGAGWDGGPAHASR